MVIYLSKNEYRLTGFWFRNPIIDLTNETGQQLVINKTYFEQVGVYACAAVNAEDYDAHTVSLYAEVNVSKTPTSKKF